MLLRRGSVRRPAAVTESRDGGDAVGTGAGGAEITMPVSAEMHHMLARVGVVGEGSLSGHSSHGHTHTHTHVEVWMCACDMGVSPTYDTCHFVTQETRKRWRRRRSWRWRPRRAGTRLREAERSGRASSTCSTPPW